MIKSMSSKRANIYVLTCVLIAICALFSSQATAQPIPIEEVERPIEYFPLEFFVGSLSSVAVERGVNYIALKYFCGPEPSETCEDYLEVVILGAITPVVSQTMGSSAGIYTTGSLNGVNGNMPAAMIGSLSGSLAGTLLQTPMFDLLGWMFHPDRLQRLQEDEDTPDWLLRIYPVLIDFWSRNETTLREISITIIPALVSSLFGSIGYNIGASLNPDR